MEHKGSEAILTERGIQKLHTFLQTAPTLLAFDFDGTLSPIVNNPDHAQLATGLEEKLVQLSQKHAVAIITGRSISDVSRRLPPEITCVIGNHGTESPLRQNDPDLGKTTAEVEELARQLSHLLNNRVDVKIEKKNLSLSLHYRHSDAPENTEGELIEQVQSVAQGFRIVRGKCVLSLTPDSLPHKGEALVELLREKKLTQAIFVGDDVTDEDVFALNAPHVLGIRVGCETETLAEFVIPAQNQMSELLDAILAL